MAKKQNDNLFREQRIGVFVDVQNLYYSARFIYKSKVNFKSILNEAIRGRQLIRAIAYVIKADVKDEINFFEVLKSFGYEVKEKDLQVFYGGAKKGDWDIGIAVDMIELAPKLDALVLISGDGDFVPLVQHVKHALGCYVEVMAFGKSSSQKLVENVDNFIDLDQNVSIRRFLRHWTFQQLSAMLQLWQYFKLNKRLYRLSKKRTLSFSWKTTF